MVYTARSVKSAHSIATFMARGGGAGGALTEAQRRIHNLNLKAAQPLFLDNCQLLD